MNDCFSTLPDDVFLIILQYSTKDDIVSTRAFQSSWVQECTVDVYMKMAAWKHNLNNMKWINERYQNTLRSNWQDEINYGDANGSLPIMEWLYKNGVAWKRNTFYAAARQGSLENMKWLYEKKCPWGDNTFTGAVRSGNLVNMKWLQLKGCNWNENTFSEAVRNGTIENLVWLKENECPLGNEFDLWDSSIDFESMKWLHDNGVPYGQNTFAMAARMGNLNYMKWLYENECPLEQNILIEAAKNGILENMVWLKSIGCPWRRLLSPVFEDSISAWIKTNLDTFEYCSRHAPPLS